MTCPMRPFATGSLSIPSFDTFHIIFQTVYSQVSKVLQQTIIFALFAHVFATADVIWKECQLQCKTCGSIQS